MVFDASGSGDSSSPPAPMGSQPFPAFGHKAFVMRKPLVFWFSGSFGKGIPKPLRKYLEQWPHCRCPATRRAPLNSVRKMRTNPLPKLVKRNPFAVCVCRSECPICPVRLSRRCRPAAGHPRLLQDCLELCRATARWSRRFRTPLAGKRVQRRRARSHQGKEQLWWGPSLLLMPRSRRVVRAHTAALLLCHQRRLVRLV